MDLETGFIHHLSAPNPYRRPDGMSMEAFCDAKVKELEDKILALGPDNVACFIAEPLLASGGVIVPPPGYQRRTWEVCRKYDVLYISDEVVTGFGRLGHIFASKEVFEIEPDIITCAKGLTSGYIPLGAMIVSDRLYSTLTDKAGRGQTFANGYTYSAHPVSCAAGMANLDIFEREDICGHVRKTGPYFRDRLGELIGARHGRRRARQPFHGLRRMHLGQEEQDGAAVGMECRQTHLREVPGKRPACAADGAPHRHEPTLDRQPCPDRFRRRNIASGYCRGHGRFEARRAVEGLIT
jgi:adenosylmethionine-8-amino-7-oxononanoate aminotransferase